MTTGPDWTAGIGVAPQNRVALQALAHRSLPRGTVIFHPGDQAQGFVVVIQGRIDVHLTGPSGREILLYEVAPGQSCIQTTLGLIADDPYTGEAVAASDAEVVVIPRPLFKTLMAEDRGFQTFVFSSFSRRMQDVTRLLQRVAFGTIEARLAEALLEMAVDGQVNATQADLAARIGSAREVVTRRLDAFARAGWVETDRGVVHLRDLAALRHIAATLL